MGAGAGLCAGIKQVPRQCNGVMVVTQWYLPSLHSDPRATCFFVLALRIGAGDLLRGCLSPL